MDFIPLLHTHTHTLTCIHGLFIVIDCFPNVEFCAQLKLAVVCFFFCIMLLIFHPKIQPENYHKYLIHILSQRLAYEYQLIHYCRFKSRIQTSFEAFNIVKSAKTSVAAERPQTLICIYFKNWIKTRCLNDDKNALQPNRLAHGLFINLSVAKSQR